MKGLTESQLNGKLRPMFRKHIDGGFWHRIENVVAAGTFDTYVAGHGKAGWIELKVAGPRAKPEVRAGQPGFGYRCLESGVPAHVLIGSPNGTIRLCEGIIMGDDWREHLVCEGRRDDKAFMNVVFRHCLNWWE